jgi:hypothetical protein
VRRSADGYLVQLRHTRDDQEARGHDVGIPAFPGSPLCPVTAVDAWLTAAHITQGALFRRVTRYQTVGATALSGAGLPRSSSAPHEQPGSLRTGSLGIPCAKGTLPPPPRTAPPTARSCARPATSLPRPSTATSAPPRSSRTTPPPGPALGVVVALC